MKAHPFVTLIASANDRAVATQVPVLVDERAGKLFLRAHIMRKTDHHLAIEQNPEVLVLFQGPHCYVSSSWYTDKQAATWNYQTVHVRGKVRIAEENELLNMLQELTAAYEQAQKQPLYIEQLPEGYVSTLVQAIVGFEIEVTDIYPIFKLSQNRDDENYKNIVKHLLATDDTNAQKVAKEMMRRRTGIWED